MSQIKIKNYEFTGIFSGFLGYNNTMANKVGGCDLGFPLLDTTTNELYMLFGDTFSSSGDFVHDWRSNVMCKIKGVTGNGQIEIDHYLTSLENRAYVLSNGHHIDQDEMTRIPTGAIEVNGVFYFYYFSMHCWKFDPDKRMNLGGLCKSLDKGKTWIKVNEITFMNDLDKPAAIQILNEDNEHHKDATHIDPKTKLNHSFTQVYPKDGGDGYIYLFAEGSYRSDFLRLGRVKKEHIEDYEEYEYLLSYNEDGTPNFVKGDEARLKMNEGNVANVCNAAFGEMSATYNPYLKKYCLFTCSDNADMSMDEEHRLPKGLYMWTADKIYGPYLDRIQICEFNDRKVNISGLYAPMTHELLSRNNGKDIYMLISQWVPLYNPVTVHIEFELEEDK